MEQCNFCGGTKTNPRPLPCNVCNGIGRVLGMLRDDPWLNIMPATSFNKSVHSDYYEHVCPQCHGQRAIMCNAWFHS